MFRPKDDPEGDQVKLLEEADGVVFFERSEGGERESMASHEFHGQFEGVPPEVEDREEAVKLPARRTRHD